MADVPLRRWRPEDYQSYLLVIARRILLDYRRFEPKFGASDVVQDTVIKANLHAGQFKGTTEEEYKGWLCAILRNDFKEKRRHWTAQERDVGRELPAEEQIDEASAIAERWLAKEQSTPSEQLQRFEQTQKLLKALGQQLTAEEFFVFTQHFLEGRQLLEIAKDLELSLTRILAIKRRAQRRMRDFIPAPDTEAPDPDEPGECHGQPSPRR
jgi:RNA polymerase sigma factor (sigma-70 family)